MAWFSYSMDLFPCWAQFSFISSCPRRKAKRYRKSKTYSKIDGHLSHCKKLRQHNDAMLCCQICRLPLISNIKSSRKDFVLTSTQICLLKSFTFHPGDWRKKRETKINWNSDSCPPSPFGRWNHLHNDFYGDSCCLYHNWHFLYFIEIWFQSISIMSPWRNII